MGTNDVSALLEDWKFIRAQSKEFLKTLSKDEQFPRPGLNSFTKHLEEMVDVQRDYVEAITTGEMVFSHTKDNDDYIGDATADSMKSLMDSADDEMQRVIFGLKGKQMIMWPEEGEKSLESHLANLCMHEAFHLGQLVAFCYSLNIAIPEPVINMWALSPQK